MKSYVGALILLAIVANVMARHTGKCQINLTQVVENCYKKNHATCKEITTFREGLKNHKVGKNKNALSYWGCLEVDSGIMVPKKPFNMDNFNRWYAKEDWPKIDPFAKKCSSGDNENIEKASDRMYDFLKCMHSQKEYKKTVTPTTTVTPAACQ